MSAQPWVAQNPPGATLVYNRARPEQRALSASFPKTGLLLRSLNQVTINQKPYQLACTYICIYIYIHIMVILIKFRKRNPEEGPTRGQLISGQEDALAQGLALPLSSLEPQMPAPCNYLFRRPKYHPIQRP